MRFRTIRFVVTLIMVCALVYCCVSAVHVAIAQGKILTPNRNSGSTLSPVSEATQGQLRALDKAGKPIGQCPLKHTSVTADVSGFVARVDVTQEFVNPLSEKIEAVYVFPLPQDAAVDQMEMTIGKRTIRGEIKRREEARRIYEAAKESGHVASLLDQERPNIFTQSVANIMPGEKVVIKISYVNLLKYENGQYEFVFPMVVGPRYIPGEPTGRSGEGWAPDTTQVPDASKITPPVTPPGTRAGHDISLEANIDAGIEIDNIESVLHDVEIDRDGSTAAHIALKDKQSIPNKDFILRYQVAGDEVRTGLLPNTRSAGDGYFSLILVPPKSPTPRQIAPKEMIFVIDTSGSQMGWPIEKSKETMKLCVEQMNPNDTFQMLGFSNDVIYLFDKPRRNTSENRALAQEFLSTRLGSGGTEMMKAVVAALHPPADPERIRIVCFMTDGYVGNDFQILDTVKKGIGSARLFSFGIGNGVNRFLLDGMADCGRGAVEYVTLEEAGNNAAKRFHNRISKPILTDISIDWGGLAASDVYPERIPDLFSSQPLILKGRYNTPGNGFVTIHGKLGGKSWSERIEVNLPAAEDENQALPALWARAKIADLMAQDYAGLQSGEANADVEEQVTKVALEYQLMSQFTSFVAVEDKIVTEGGKPKKVAVPVEMPEGVSYEGVFGHETATDNFSSGGAFRSKAMKSPGSVGSYFASAPSSPPMQPAANNVFFFDGHVKTKRLEVSNGAISPAEQKKRAIETRLDPLLRGLGAKLDKNGNYSKPGKVEVKSGKVKISIRLASVSAANIAKLKALGFEALASSKAVKMLIGRAPVKNLEALAQLDFVLKIAPVN
ncbi:MAG: VIT domain-containing protein [Armatimonadota bacterium]|nr:VIT domain-containing protein [Armatimonadota bacterium]